MNFELSDLEARLIATTLGVTSSPSSGMAAVLRKLRGYFASKGYTRSTGEGCPPLVLRNAGEIKFLCTDGEFLRGVRFDDSIAIEHKERDCT